MLKEIAEGVRAGRVDPVELVEQALARAEQATELNAIVQLDADGARRAAAQLLTGPLAGVPVLVKEIIEIEGLPYRCGSATMDGIGQRDAGVVRQLRAAGAIVIGLSHTHEFAYGCTGTSNRVGPCRNPHDLTRMTGGSSSGAGAAVAAGVVPLAIGTDTAGSVRIPAALCGVVGFKPAYATLPVDGVFPLAQSLDHIGVLTTTVADAAYALAALTGEELPATTKTAPRLGVVVNAEYLDHTPEVGAAWSAALARLESATLVDVRLPDWAETFTAAADLQGPEAAANHLGRSIDLYQPDVRERLREAAEVPQARYEAAREKAAVITAALQSTLDQVDAILTPTVLTTAPPIDAMDNDEKTVRAQILRTTRLANLTGYPAVTLPIPTTGLPVGLQVIAKSNAKAADVACWIELALQQT
ncbi:aspartyl-tRNA(Asn)/glutamyl-tRNA(Gln) amidotransferase subunit A [Kribbella amoyensis]|uniref:Aspartyl-tRNA(Asn)/glutamyl-tRNA(Gln) amidotransferase subunit A n=1 Tax=Kribbella amoyensis TaxID=996641 RepID=A0A561BNX1_9ACTN|nr:amidase [Kribbella amoyensis]TWD80560.1 aspartyl-tRNA(Asn)/glutamyl-tRNA(Gln) amidotransferase subunit A [Kribbella amoyensis]